MYSLKTHKLATPNDPTIFKISFFYRYEFLLVQVQLLKIFLAVLNLEI